MSTADVKKKFAILSAKQKADIHCASRFSDMASVMKDFIAGNLEILSMNEAEVRRVDRRYVCGGKYHESPSWSTYDKCQEVELTHQGNIRVTIWDGDFARGEITDLRYKAIFSGDWSKYDFIVDAVNRTWNSYVASVFNIEEEKRRKDRMAEIEKELLI